MIVLGRIQRLTSISTENGPRLAIRVMGYHRGHLSLRPGTQVFLALYPGGSRPGKFPEMMGTTIHRDSWRYLLRIALTLKDRPGVVHQVLESVAAQGGNVLYLDSSSIEQERYHRIEAIVDFRPLLYGGSWPPDELAALVHGILLADCCDSIVWHDNQPKVRVCPMRSLQRMDGALGHIASPQTLIVGCEVKENGYVILPPELVDDINYEMQQSFGDHPPVSEDTGYLLTSDTEERTFHVHVLSKRQLVLWCAIRHKDRAGALAAITASLRDANITILTSLNRLEAHLGASWFEGVLVCDQWLRTDDAPLSVHLKSMQDHVGRILQSVPDTYDCRVYFRARDADDAVRNGKVAVTRTPLRDQRRPISLRSWLGSRSERLDALEPQASSTSAKPQPFLHSGLDDLEGPTERKTLAMGLSEVIRIANLRPRRLFLSIAHTRANEELVAVVRDVCQSMGFSCDVVDATERDMGVRAEIRRRIELATHFLAVWTDSRWDANFASNRSRGRPNDSRPATPGTVERTGDRAARRKDDPRDRRPRPSPWCLWEIAVAEVLNRPRRVLIQDGISRADYEALYSAEFAFRFVRNRKLDEFRRKVEQAVQSLL